MVIACIEEIAYKNQWISFEQFTELAEQYPNSQYGKFLKGIAAVKI